MAGMSENEPEVLDAECTALASLKPCGDDEAWKAIETTRYYAPVDKDKFRAKELFGDWLGVKLTPQFLSVNIFEALELLQEELRAASQIAQDTGEDKETRIQAMGASALITRQISQMSNQVHNFLAIRKPRRNGSKALPPPREGTYVYAQAETVYVGSDGMDKSGKKPPSRSGPDP